METLGMYVCWKWSVFRRTERCVVTFIWIPWNEEQMHDKLLVICHVGRLLRLKQK